MGTKLETRPQTRSSCSSNDKINFNNYKP